VNVTGAPGHVAVVILAAGTGSRMGRVKQMLPLAGRPVLQHVLDAAAASGAGEIVVVLGHAADEVTAALALHPHARTVMAADHREGQSASLRTGLRALGPGARAAVILLGDQPTLPPEAIRSVIETFERTGGPVVQARYGGKPGHPVALGRAVWEAVEALRGDAGARDLLAEHPEWIVHADVEGAPPPDLDTEEDYRRLSTRRARGLTDEGDDQGGRR